MGQIPAQYTYAGTRSRSYPSRSNPQTLPASRRRRRVNSPAMASPVRPVRRRLEATLSPPQPADLTDDLLEEIVVRIGSPADLARASTACVFLRSLIADPSFLRRYRSLHPPLLLGFLSHGFDSAEAPHPNAPAAAALARAAGFSFDYLPRGRWDRWDPCDVRDGRVLLKCSPPGYAGAVFPDLAVCDPLSRRYMLLPAIPGAEQKIKSFDAFLVPSGDWEETSFKVISMTHCKTKMMVFDFSSISGCWTVGASANWDDLIPQVESRRLSWPWYAYGCFYWKLHMTTKLLKLDMNRMEFSTVGLPPYHDARTIVIVEAGEGALGMFSRIKHGTYLDYYTIVQNESERNNNWQMRNIIPLPANYNCYIAGAAEGYIFLVGTPKIQGTECAAYFSLEIKTLEIERVSTIRFPFCHLCPYFGFPPSMSPRRI